MNRAEQLAADHWNGYIVKLLAAHDLPQRDIAIAKFHYQSAFIHGYKHAEQDLDVGDIRLETIGLTGTTKTPLCDESIQAIIERGRFVEKENADI